MQIRLHNLKLGAKIFPTVLNPMNSILSVGKDEPPSIGQRRNSRSLVSRVATIILRASFLFVGKYAELLFYILSQSMHECNPLCTRPGNISLPTSGLVLGSYTVERF